ncbi:MAG: hypothetical protein ACRC62_13005 [Microcoleus sp.]
MSHQSSVIKRITVNYQLLTLNYLNIVVSIAQALGEAFGPES